jgi:hypothetical protein
VGLARDDRENAGEGARATNFKTELDVFRAFVKAGERLADLHVNYEKQPEYPLEKIEKKGENWIGACKRCASAAYRRVSCPMPLFCQAPV